MYTLNFASDRILRCGLCKRWPELFEGRSYDGSCLFISKCKFPSTRERLATSESCEWVIFFSKFTHTHWVDRRSSEDAYLRSDRSDRRGECVASHKFFETLFRVHIRLLDSHKICDCLKPKLAVARCLTTTREHMGAEERVAARFTSKQP